MNLRTRTVQFTGVCVLLPRKVEIEIFNYLSHSLYPQLFCMELLVTGMIIRFVIFNLIWQAMILSIDSDFCQTANDLWCIFYCKLSKWSYQRDIHTSMSECKDKKKLKMSLLKSQHQTMLYSSFLYIV